MKTLDTRPKRAVRLARRLFTLLVIATLFCGVNLTPRQAVADIADRVDMKGGNTFITAFYDGTLPITRFSRQYLVDGENAILLCAVSPSIMGWYDRDWCKVETWDGAPVHAGLRMHTQGGKRTAWLFGRVDHGYIDTLSLHADAIVWEDNTHRKVTQTFEVPRDAIFRGKNDRRYILAPVEIPYDEEDTIRYRSFRILGYDYSGAVLADEEVNFQSWSTSAD